MVIALLCLINRGLDGLWIEQEVLCNLGRFNTAIWDGLTPHFEAPIISARSSGVNCLRLVILPDIWPKGVRLGGILQLLCTRVEFRVAKKSRKNALGFKLMVGYCN